MMVRDLAWLVQLGELGHVTETAAALGTSQPTLSRALARLEEELGVRVFERTPTGVEPTPDGRLVLDAARDLVARHDQLRAARGRAVCHRAWPVLHGRAAAPRQDGVVGVPRAGVARDVLPGLQEDRNQPAENHQDSKDGQNYGKDVIHSPSFS